MTDSTTTAPAVIAADYHRNGVGGVGFFVGLVDDPDGGRMLIITFGGDDDEMYTAALNVDQAAAGNIFMFPTDGVGGGNAWRGDRYAATYRQAIIDTVRSHY